MSERTYTKEHARQFVEDMVEAGLVVEHYLGRYFYEGPAVRVRSLQDALSFTRVPCQWDEMGRGSIVYPRESDPGVPAEVGKEA